MGKTKAQRTAEIDRKAIEAYRAQWGGGPFETVDCAIFHKRKILLVLRANPPQASTWATPGGFLEKGERPYGASLRELVEETRFKMSLGGRQLADADEILEAMRGALVGKFRQEGPERDPRAHINTTVFVFDLDRIGVTEQPDIEAADDARDAKWQDLDEARGLRTYADHGTIVAKAAKMAGRA